MFGKKSDIATMYGPKELAEFLQGIARGKKFAQVIATKKTFFILLCMHRVLKTTKLMEKCYLRQRIVFSEN